MQQSERFLLPRNFGRSARLAVLVAIVLCHSTIATAHDGTVNITGSILAASCTVAASDATKSVPIGDYSSGSLTTVGQKTAFKTFSITLQNCSAGIAGTRVTVTGQADSNNTDLLALSNPGAAGTATGVAVLVTDSTGNTIKINNASALQTLSSGTNTVGFQLAYEVTKTPVGAGDASAVMYLDFAYQ